MNLIFQIYLTFDSRDACNSSSHCRPVRFHLDHWPPPTAWDSLEFSSKGIEELYHSPFCAHSLLLVDAPLEVLGAPKNSQARNWFSFVHSTPLPRHSLEQSRSIDNIHFYSLRQTNVYIFLVESLVWWGFLRLNYSTSMWVHFGSLDSHHLCPLIENNRFYQTVPQLWGWHEVCSEIVVFLRMSNSTLNKNTQTRASFFKSLYRCKADK